MPADETLIQAVEQHATWINPMANLEWIYNHMSCYSACLIFLKANKREIPETHFEIIGEPTLETPELDYEWLSILLEYYLFKGQSFFKEYEIHRTSIENCLRRHGILERNQVNFTHNRRLTGLLNSSISKLNAIRDIVDFEYQQLGKDLRLVILSDFIRKEFLTTASENNLDLNKIGVIPIFEKLRRENNNHKKLAVLTGSVIIIPQTVLPAFQIKASNYGVHSIQCNPLPFDKQYIAITPSEQLKHDIVHIITQLFQRGEIEVLVGSKSLLGEGWDAPAINTLVLSSFVGSFVLSNQMRGRAIRTQQGNRNKTGNIWHIVCVDPGSFNGGDDFVMLFRRFRSFVGVSFKDEPGIENGWGRLNLPENILVKETAMATNTEMLRHAGNRHNLQQRWDEALAGGMNLVEQIKIPFRDKRTYAAITSLYYTKTIRNLMVTLGTGVATYMVNSLKALQNMRDARSLVIFLSALFATGALIFGRETYKAFRMYIKYRDISKDLQRIGEAFLNALVHASLVSAKANHKVVTHADPWGAVYCHLEGESTYDRSAFISALQEVISPIENPRYIIIRKSKLMFLIKQGDYHAVPEGLGRKKEFAEYFEQQWRLFVGKCELIFTRYTEGRKLILKSRVQSLAAQFEEKIKHVNKWR